MALARVIVYTLAVCMDLMPIAYIIYCLRRKHGRD